MHHTSTTSISLKVVNYNLIWMLSILPLFYVILISKLYLYQVLYKIESAELCGPMQCTSVLVVCYADITLSGKKKFSHFDVALFDCQM